MNATDEQLKQIIENVTKLEKDITDLNESIDDMKKGQNSISILLEKILNTQ